MFPTQVSYLNLSLKLIFNLSDFMFFSETLFFHTSRNKTYHTRTWTPWTPTLPLQTRRPTTSTLAVQIVADYKLQTHKGRGEQSTTSDTASHKLNWQDQDLSIEAANKYQTQVSGPDITIGPCNMHSSSTAVSLLRNTTAVFLYYVLRSTSK